MRRREDMQADGGRMFSRIIFGGLPMRKWMRRIRGAVGLGLTWAAAWFGGGAIVGLLFGGGFATIIPVSVVFAVMGFIGGAAFSGVLGIAERRRTLMRCRFHGSRFGGPWVVWWLDSS